VKILKVIRGSVASYAPVAAAVVLQWFDCLRRDCR
jgi:hypothetical protein